MSALTVNFVTPGEDIVSTEVVQVTAPSVGGEVGIMADHLPLLASLDAGVVGLHKSSGDAEYFAVSGGFVEVYNNVVTILGDTAEKAENIDAKRAKRSLEDATAQLKTLDYVDPEYAEQERRQKRNQVRVAAAALAKH